MFQTFQLYVALGGTPQDITGDVDVIFHHQLLLDGAQLGNSFSKVMTATGAKEGQIKIITMNTATNKWKNSNTCCRKWIYKLSIQKTR